MTLRILPGQANTTCADCRHYRLWESGDEGTCPEAAEALALEGWPRSVVYLEPHMSAETCPGFDASGEHREKVQSWADEAADMEFRRRRDEQDGRG